MSSQSRPRRVVRALVLAAFGAFATAAAAQSDSPAGGDGASPASPQRKVEAPASAPDPTVEEVTVTGTSVTDAVDQARFAESIVDVLSAEDFATTGDSSVVDALSRVTGVTTNDKYVFVRGLSERYSSTLFNGAVLPSPDPTRRVLPLDLFPSSAMEQLSVQKTYSPQLPADFAGGAVLLSSRAVPVERDFQFDVSIKTNTNTTGKSRAWVDGGDADWTGFDNGYRKMPSGLRDLEDGVPVTEEERQVLGRKVNRSFDVENESIPPGYEMKGHYANSWKTPAGKFGLLLAGQGENDWQYRKQERCETKGRVGCIGPFEAGAPRTDGRTERLTQNNIDYAALGSIDYKPWSSQLLKATVFWTHLTENRLEIDDPGFHSESDRFFSETYSEWEERSLLSAQLSGSHDVRALHELALDWSLTWSQATRDVPDARFYRSFYNDADSSDGLDPGLGSFFDTAAGNSRTWEELEDQSWDANVNGSMPLAVARFLQTTIKAGGKYFTKDRVSDTHRFRYLLSGAADPGSLDGESLEDIFRDDRIEPRFWRLVSAPLGTDDYTASEEVGAGYLQLDNQVGDRLRLMGGARFESYRQETILETATDASTVIDEKKFYPATELTYSIRDDLQLRGAWSRTTNRPDMRELADVVFFNPENRIYYTGNPNLKPSDIDNYDLRLEWYHGAGDSTELAGFYKTLKNPIEELENPTTTRKRTWKNSKEAVLWGLEVAAQQNLGVLGRWADDFTVRANAAYIFSESTDAPENSPIATNRKHPLQGQSEWVVNFQVTHDYLPWDLKNTLAVNVFGERLSAIGACASTQSADCETIGDLDEYEQPTPTLDYVLRWGFTLFQQDFGLVFKAKNLLDPKHEWTRGPYTTREFSEGRDFTIEIGYDF